MGLSQQRLVIAVATEPLVDVTWDSGDARLLDLATGDDGLSIGFHGEHFGADPQRVELRLRIADAAALQAAIEQRRRPPRPRRYRQADA